jgi:hypothetical protein
VRGFAFIPSLSLRSEEEVFSLCLCAPKDKTLRIIDIVFIIIGIYAYAVDNMPLAMVALTIVLGLQVFIMIKSIIIMREQKKEMKCIQEMLIKTHYEYEQIEDLKKTLEGTE